MGGALLGVLMSLAILDELPFDVGDLAGVRGGEVRAGDEPRASPQLCALPTSRVPLGSRDHEATLHDACLGVLGQPCSQPRPLAEQRLVGHLHVVGAEGEEPGVRQGTHHRGHARVRQRHHLGQRDPAAGG